MAGRNSTVVTCHQIAEIYGGRMDTDQDFVIIGCGFIHFLNDEEPQAIHSLCKQLLLFLNSFGHLLLGVDYYPGYWCLAIRTPRLERARLA